MDKLRSKREIWDDRALEVLHRGQRQIKQMSDREAKSLRLQRSNQYRPWYIEGSRIDGYHASKPEVLAAYLKVCGVEKPGPWVSGEDRYYTHAQVKARLDVEQKRQKKHGGARHDPDIGEDSEVESPSGPPPDKPLSGVHQPQAREEPLDHPVLAPAQQQLPPHAADFHSGPSRCASLVNNMGNPLQQAANPSWQPKDSADEELLHLMGQPNHTTWAQRQHHGHWDPNEVT